MQLSRHIDLRDGSSCELHYEETNNWLRAIWRGHVDPLEAYNGAERLLKGLEAVRCPCLLNDNSRLRGPWFDSVEWLRGVWVPRAEALGLRYIAHVSQPHDRANEAAVVAEQPFGLHLELQLFDDVAAAEEWLRAVQG